MLSKQHRRRQGVTTLLIAVMPLMAAAACPAGETSPARVGNPGPPLPGREETPSCEQVHYRRGIHGMVVGSEWVDGGPYDGLRCLEIETRTGDYILIRVSQKVFNKCIERDPWPRCATRKDS